MTGEANSEWHFKGWGGSPDLKESDVNVIAGCPGGMGCCINFANSFYAIFSG